MTNGTLTTNGNGFSIDIRMGNTGDDYTLATEAQREQFLVDLDAAMAKRGFDTDAQWSSFDDTQIDGTSTRRADDLEEQYPGIVSAFEAAYNEALGL